MKNVIVIAAHPDDETLGVGGTILKHVANGDNVAWLIITRLSEQKGFSLERIRERENEIRKVSELYGFSKVYQLDFDTTSLSSSSLQNLIPKISNVFNEFKPEIIYTMNRSDIHSDHRIIFDAVFACTKSFRYPFVKRVLMYECISETEFAPALNECVFVPNYFVDISSFLANKLEIMNVYDSELGIHPFPRSLKNIEALSIYRGASVGVEHAEAFQLLKYID